MRNVTDFTSVHMLLHTLALYAIAYPETRQHVALTLLQA